METLKVFVCNEVKWILDPLKKFQHVSPEELVNHLGLIPDFIINDPETVEQTALGRYGFWAGPPMSDGTVNKDFSFSYPGDPDLYPLAIGLVGEKETFVVVYKYGMIAFLHSSGKASVYRFD